jgi:hypothetical protein
LALHLLLLLLVGAMLMPQLLLLLRVSSCCCRTSRNCNSSLVLLVHPEEFTQAQGRAVLGTSQAAAGSRPKASKQLPHGAAQEAAGQRRGRGRQLQPGQLLLLALLLLALRVMCKRWGSCCCRDRDARHWLQVGAQPFESLL